MNEHLETAGLMPPMPWVPCSCDPSPPRIPVVSALRLAFFVSRDEEYVRLILVEPFTQELGEYAHHYLLLTLARHRLADASRGIEPAACGWMPLDRFAHDPAMTRERVNIDVHRARRQLERVGVADAMGIVERRRATREIRIGTDRVLITRV